MGFNSGFKGLKQKKTEAVRLATSMCFGKHVLCYFLHFVPSQFIAYISLIQGVPLATEPVIYLIILTPIKIFATKFEEEYVRCVGNVTTS